MSRPVRVSRGRPSEPSSIAPSSWSRVRPSRIARWSGGSTKGNESTGPRSRSAIDRITDARLVRRISGSVNSGRASKSSSEYSRMHTPSATRPHRPARCAAEACETGSIGSRWTLVRVEYLEMRASPVSTT